MWLKKLRRLIRLFFFQLTGKKGDKMAKLTKPIIAVNIDGTVRVLNQDPNATHFNWYTRELLSYSITSPSYDVVVAGTNESTTALPNSSYTNRVYITESYRDIRKFTSFKLYEAGSSAVDVTELYVTKISDFEYSISIPNVEHDYIITWGVGAITYTITSSLTNCVADKSDKSYVGGTAVNIVITAATGYTFDRSLGGTIGLSVGEVDKTSEYMTRSSDNKKVTIAIPAIAAIGNIIYAAGAVEEITQLATPTVAMNADGKTLEITDVADATSYDVYVDGTLKTNVASVPNTTTVDLSTLSDITEGAHTVKVKAKANGYIDSEFSNEVSYTKAPAGYKVTFASDFSSTAYSGGELSDVTLTANTGASTPLTSAARGLVWQGVSSVTLSRVLAWGVYYTDASGKSDIFNGTFTLTSDITITGANDQCLTGDMLITLADGTTKRIDTITLADRVLAYNPETMALEADEIIRCDSDKIKTHSEYDIWTFDDGTVVKTVHRHRLYNAEKQAMVYMDEWNVGDHAVKIDGTKVALVNHVNVQEEVRHYTIFTNHQNYFVNGLLSGNRYTKRLFVDV